MEIVYDVLKSKTQGGNVIHLNGRVHKENVSYFSRELTAVTTRQ